MTPPAHDRAARSDPPAQIAQRVRTYVSKTDQTAQPDQHPENAEEFGTLLGLELTSRHRKLTSGTAQQTDSGALCADHPSSGAHQATAARPAP
jgi:hypothetical protein